MSSYSNTSLKDICSRGKLRLIVQKFALFNLAQGDLEVATKMSSAC